MAGKYVDDFWNRERGPVCRNDGRVRGHRRHRAVRLGALYQRGMCVGRDDVRLAPEAEAKMKLATEQHDNRKLTRNGKDVLHYVRNDDVYTYVDTIYVFAEREKVYTFLFRGLNGHENFWVESL